MASIESAHTPQKAVGIVSVHRQNLPANIERITSPSHGTERPFFRSSFLVLTFAKGGATKANRLRLRLRLTRIGPHVLAPRPRAGRHQVGVHIVFAFAKSVANSLANSGKGGSHFFDSVLAQTLANDS